MPDTLNKQALINLLIDSPLREPIKINLIDIVNNTTEPDLPKVYSTIVKELEIFQKATERRMKLADETITKLGGATPAPAAVDPTTAPVDTAPAPTAPAPAPVTPQSAPIEPAAATTTSPDPTPLAVPPLDLPPLPEPTPTPAVEMTQPVAPAPAPVADSTPSTLPTPEPLGGMAPTTASSDEAALAEIQKELESLKAGVAADANPAPSAPTASPTATQ